MTDNDATRPAQRDPDCLFCKIVAREVPADVVHETETTLAFRDIQPQAPTHVLVIPKAHHRDAVATALAAPALLTDVVVAAGEVARQEGVADSGYRIVTNTGRDAQQSVDHLHLHVVGGRGLQWPPG
ncbi:histidine triad nucleotide-binding protein [Arsenicicoccus sp. oral taxon 190]|uniref:histidine triad nucleotide-binding protein n=1 Tax=Arsenicicoccus sp. oral taxon 190 TaxID=1658671 RepID=UPI00067A10C5|nr:histidine triad nucleotide-binding protein [Arsenicicoccus sp. oral taxon 190]AKT52161.1 histidine triad (HIT) protein [Arsenicicoccus sp. oral taxon 190]